MLIIPFSLSLFLPLFPPLSTPPQDAPSTQGIQGRYASALFAAGKKANALDAVDKDLTQVRRKRERESSEKTIALFSVSTSTATTTFNSPLSSSSPHPHLPSTNPKIRALAAQSPAFAAFLKDRSVAKSAKGKQLEAILTDLKAADLTKNFMSLLAANNRLSEISRVAATFGSLVAHSRGQVMAVVTTADPLSADEAEEIRKGLSEVLPKGKTLQLSTKVDASIIGGVVVDIGDKHIDLSIASRVKQVEQLIAAGLN